MRLDWHPDKSRVVDLQHKPIPYRQSEAIKDWGGRYGARPNFERRIHQARPIIMAYDRCQLHHGPAGGLGNGVAAA
jgi:hypothetical protein